MKRLIILFTIIILSFPVLAQLEVKEGSFREVPGFVNVNPDENYQTDDNDLPYAVIKVRTENINDKQRRELKFSGNAGTFIMLEYKDGEVWVYLTAKYADYLKISHPDFSSIEFTLPIDLLPKKGYELTIVNKSSVDEALLTRIERLESAYGGNNVNNTTQAIASLGVFEDKIITVKGVSFKMIAVEGGTFIMGCTSEQCDDCDKDEKPVHNVTLSDYYIGEYEVTQDLWVAVMGNNPSYNKGSGYPVENVSWNDCQEFIIRLNRMTGLNFILPTEAQWEYAARGGNKSLGFKYSGSNDIELVACCAGYNNNKTNIVGIKKPNELGIYDMSGNVWEWCQNWDYGYSSIPLTDPQGPSRGAYHVLRGGGWTNNIKNCRVSDRSRNGSDKRRDDYGLRLVLMP